MIKLGSDEYPELLKPVRDVPFNVLFARSVVEGIVEGEAWVDRRHDASITHVVHPYGMSLLLARDDVTGFSDFLQWVTERRRAGREFWMQVHPQRLVPLLDRLFGLDPGFSPESGAAGAPRIRRFTRVNFRFNAPCHADARKTMAQRSAGVELRPMRIPEFDLPDIGVSPARFWDDAGQFLGHGGGWCVLQDGDVTAIAFTSFRLDGQLEIGVETRSAYRGLGHARHAACALIDACLASGLEPVWSCRKENAASFRLARSLGFEPVFEGAYYHLPALS